MRTKSWSSELAQGENDRSGLDLNPSRRYAASMSSLGMSSVASDPARQAGEPADQLMKW
jgi:hypothetical protein